MSAITGPSLAGGTLYVLTVLVFTWITRQPCIRHDYYTYTTLRLYRHRIRFVVSSDVPLNPACRQSVIGAERPILIPSIHIHVGVYLVFITHVRDHFAAATGSASLFFADGACFGVCIYKYLLTYVRDHFAAAAASTIVLRRRGCSLPPLFRARCRCSFLGSPSPHIPLGYRGIYTIIYTYFNRQQPRPPRFCETVPALFRAPRTFTVQVYDLLFSYFFVFGPQPPVIFRGRRRETYIGVYR